MTLAGVRPPFATAFLDPGRQLRLSYLPPLMVYLAAGISGLTSIVGTFFVKEYLDLSAEFLAGLAFWANMPWAIKMPLGHVVDLIWRYKAGLVYLGAGLIAASLLIMQGLIGDRAAMEAVMPVGAWYVLQALLAPIGYVLQDVVADAMTVEAVPRVDETGHPIDQAERKSMNTTMQTLGRVAIVGGTIIVALINLYLFRDVQSLSAEGKAAVYQDVYRVSLVIPLISVLGVLLAGLMRRRAVRRLRAAGLAEAAIELALRGSNERPRANPWILGGSLMFVAFSLAVGLAELPFGQEIIFAGSMAIVAFLMQRLMREMEPAARQILLGTAIVIFAFRAVPTPGPGVTWWMIDVLGFDQQFLSVLALIGGGLALLGMLLFRRLMAERSITFVITLLTIAGTLLALPIIGMYFGLHQWTAAVTGGIVDARFIALVDTALESPLGQVAMIPMLAWIANSAPVTLKATFFAVMASFVNLALGLAQLGTKYLNRIFVVSREVTDPVSGAVSVPADYSALGLLLITTAAIGFLLPIASIGLIRALRLRSA